MTVIQCQVTGCSFRSKNGVLFDLHALHRHGQGDAQPPCQIVNRSLEPLFDGDEPPGTVLGTCGAAGCVGVPPRRFISPPCADAPRPSPAPFPRAPEPLLGEVLTIIQRDYRCAWARALAKRLSEETVACFACATLDAAKRGGCRDGDRLPKLEILSGTQRGGEVHVKSAAQKSVFGLVKKLSTNIDGQPLGPTTDHWHPCPKVCNVAGGPPAAVRWEWGVFSLGDLLAATSPGSSLHAAAARCALQDYIHLGAKCLPHISAVFQLAAAGEWHASVLPRLPVSFRAQLQPRALVCGGAAGAPDRDGDNSDDDDVAVVAGAGASPSAAPVAPKLLPTMRSRGSASLMSLVTPGAAGSGAGGATGSAAKRKRRSSVDGDLSRRGAGTSAAAGRGESQQQQRARHAREPAVAHPGPAGGAPAAGGAAPAAAVVVNPAIPVVARAALRDTSLHTVAGALTLLGGLSDAYLHGLSADDADAFRQGARESAAGLVDKRMKAANACLADAATRVAAASDAVRCLDNGIDLVDNASRRLSALREGLVQARARRVEALCPAASLRDVEGQRAVAQALCDWFAAAAAVAGVDGGVATALDGPISAVASPAARPCVGGEEPVPIADDVDPVAISLKIMKCFAPPPVLPDV